MSVYSSGSLSQFLPQSLEDTITQQSDLDSLFNQPSPAIFTSVPPSPFIPQTPQAAAPASQLLETIQAPEALVSILTRLKEHVSQIDLRNTFYIDSRTNEVFFTNTFQFVSLCTEAEAEIKASKIAFETAYSILVKNFLEIFEIWKKQADTDSLFALCDLILNNLEKSSFCFCTFSEATIQFDNKHPIFHPEFPDLRGVQALFWKQNWSGVVKKIKQIPATIYQFEEVGLISELFARNVRWQELSQEQISAEIEKCSFYPLVERCQESHFEVVQLLKGFLPSTLSPSKNLLRLRTVLLLKNGAYARTADLPVRMLFLNEWHQAALKRLENNDLELKMNSELIAKANDSEMAQTGEKRLREIETMLLDEEEPPSKIPNTTPFYSMDTDGDIF